MTEHWYCWRSMDNTIYGRENGHCSNYEVLKILKKIASGNTRFAFGGYLCDVTQNNTFAKHVECYCADNYVKEYSTLTFALNRKKEDEQ